MWQGAGPTAVEVNVADGTTAESEFMQGILGESEYSFDVGHNFSHIIADKFRLNQKYIRGWWFNPGQNSSSLHCLKHCSTRPFVSAHPVECSSW